MLKACLSSQDLTLIQRLRFEVFNIELGEGLSSSFQNGLDIDDFDAICTHLYVEHLPSKSIVGTYRMQTGQTAMKNLGYYSGREFNLEPLEFLRDEIVELGRACITKEHRNYFVLSLLWQGVAQFAQNNNARYLIGCSSITSQNPQDAEAAFNAMEKYLAPEDLHVLPKAGFESLPTEHSKTYGYKLPKLLSAYLSLGAWICGPPAIDREFKTIDFLTLLDLDNPNMQNKLRRFLP